MPKLFGAAVSDALARLSSFREDMPAHAEACLKILDKGGDLVPLKLNTVQRMVHDKLEQQLAEKGWIRAIILKGRRPGISTYVAGRYYSKASLRRGRNVYILAHEQPASDNLFGIVDRYQRHNPFAPHVGTANVKELVFDRMESSYAVATAGQKAGGRSRTIQLFHGSEVAFWPNAGDHFKSSIQAVSLVPDTEIILESTANGPSGKFYEIWQQAEAGLGDYQAIFIPWFMDPDNTREVPPNFDLNREGADGQLSEAEIAETYSLTMGQMAWRRGKVLELGSEEAFQQEFPSTASEAFVAADYEPYIKPALVMRARKNKIEGYGPLIFGVDPASMGGDRFAVAARRGPRVEWVKFRTKVDPEEGKAWVRSLIDEHDPARVFIDAGNIGYAIISGLRALGPQYVEKIRAVNFGGTSEWKLARPKVPGPGNRRAEMWGRSLEWLQAPEGAAIPDMEVLQSDACAPKKKPRLNGDFLLESKEEMKARSVRSPDLWDGIVLTFAALEFIQKYSEPKKVTPFGVLDKPKAAPLPVVGGPNAWMC